MASVLCIFGTVTDGKVDMTNVFKYENILSEFSIERQTSKTMEAARFSTITTMTSIHFSSIWTCSLITRPFGIFTLPWTLIVRSLRPLLMASGLT